VSSYLLAPWDDRLSRIERPPRMRCRTASVGSLSLVEPIEQAGDGRTLRGTFSIFDRWQEISSPIEGHFMERIGRGAFSKSIKENLSGVKLLYSHGRDAVVGSLLLGELTGMEERADGAHYEAELFAGVPPLLLDGLRKGLYGSSFRAKVVKERFDPRPGPSSHNPEGLPESIVSELKLIDVGPTSMPAYSSTTAQVRSKAQARAEVVELGEELPSWFLKSEQPWFLNPKERYAHRR
jgi:phage head maturation protease